MFLTELIAKGGPVLYLLFILTLFILYIVINKYFFILSDQKHWYKNRLFFRQDIHQRLTKLNKDLKDDIKSRGYSY